MKKNTFAFSLIELLVAATILVVLTSIGFYSYTTNISSARDSTRKTDLSALSSQLSLYKQERGAYPFPGDNFTITNQGEAVALQGYMNKKVTLSTADRIPLDPELDIPYRYSTTINRQEYQISGSLENSGSPTSVLLGKYSSVAKDVLPTIMLAIDANSDTEISAPSTTNPARDLFIFNNGFHTLPYDFETGAPFTDGASFLDLLNDAGDEFWQNSDYRSCEEIATAGKRITPDGQNDWYQILDNTGTLIDEECSCTSTGCTAA